MSLTALALEADCSFVSGGADAFIHEDAIDPHRRFFSLATNAGCVPLADRLLDAFAFFQPPPTLRLGVDDGEFFTNHPEVAQIDAGSIFGSIWSECPVGEVLALEQRLGPSGMEHGRENQETDAKIPKHDVIYQGVACAGRKRLGFFQSTSAGVPFSDGPMQGHATSTEAMEALGRVAASTALPGSIIALVGGLGAGKTHWTKGFVAGAGSPFEVTSPTFGLVQEYTGGRFPVFHLDFYRLESAAELIALGWDELLDQNAVIIAEWADKFPELLPGGTTWLHFIVEADGSRTVHQSTPRAL